MQWADAVGLLQPTRHEAVPSSKPAQKLQQRPRPEQPVIARPVSSASKAATMQDALQAKLQVQPQLLLLIAVELCVSPVLVQYVCLVVCQV